MNAGLGVLWLWPSQVTLDGCEHHVSHAYCSAMPVNYSGLPAAQWERFARMILEAAYEATLYAAILNAHKSGNNHVLLTSLGGGAFGNPVQWNMGPFHERSIPKAVMISKSPW